MSHFLWTGADNLKNNKFMQALKAKQHTQDMSKQYRYVIDKLSRDTIEYYPAFTYDKILNPVATEFCLVATDSVTAIMNNRCDKMAVLNFASFKNPGGGFLNGSTAQEECLCHESMLYNVLATKTDYYRRNLEDLAGSLYRNRALYTPDVVFKRGKDEVLCGVITCAAPNKRAASHKGGTNAQNSLALESRIRFVFDIAKDNNVSTLILGAYGCGVFGQSGDEVAHLFHSILTEPAYTCFDKIVFAVPDKDSSNYKAFAKEFNL